MDEPTALLPPVSTRGLDELLDDGPLPLGKGLELLSVIAGQVARMHAGGQTHGLLAPNFIRVQTYENGPPVVVLVEPEATRDMSEGSDLWALGVLAFWVLAGRPPKSAETLAAAMPTAPPALEKVVSKLMAPRPQDRLSASGAQRQFHDLAGTTTDPAAKAAAPLGALPQLRRGVPITAPKSDAHAWVKDRRTDPPSPNPFADDEATATGHRSEETELQEPSPEVTPPPPKRKGPAMEDEPTQYVPQAELERQRKQRARAAAERANTPLPPPVPTPTEQPDLKRAEPTNEVFEPSRSDLPSNTDDGLVDPRLQARRRKRAAGEHSPMSDFMHVAKKQPPWVWGAIGVGVAFFVLLLIALAR